VSVVKLQMYKTLFVLAAHYDLEVNQMNVTIAFLYGSIDQVVYVELPHSYELSDKVALLNKALYGLKQAPHLWYKTLHDLLMSLDFVDLILIIACLYETVSSSLSMLMTFCLLKRISQLFRTLNNVLMTHSRCQISVLCSTI
jgi:hypothetical protein